MEHHGLTTISWKCLNRTGRSGWLSSYSPLPHQQHPWQDTHVPTSTWPQSLAWNDCLKKIPISDVKQDRSNCMPAFLCSEASGSTSGLMTAESTSEYSLHHLDVVNCVLEFMQDIYPLSSYHLPIVWFACKPLPHEAAPLPCTCASVNCNVSVAPPKYCKLMSCRKVQTYPQCQQLGICRECLLCHESGGVQKVESQCVVSAAPGAVDV